MKPCIVRNSTDVRSKYFATNSMQNDKVILDTISNSNSPLAPLAKKLSSLSIGHIPVHLKPVSSLYNFTLNDGTKAQSAGDYDPKKKTVSIAEFSQHGNTEALIMHEILHGMTYKELRKNTKARADFNAIYQQALAHKNKFHPNSQYGLENLDEFMVAIFTNPHFIKDMQSVPGSNQGVALFSDLLDFFKKLFKLSPEHSSLFDDAFITSNLVLEQASQSFEEDVAYEKERAEAMAAYEHEPAMTPNMIPASNTDLEKKYKLRNKDGSRKRFPSETKAVDKARKLNKANKDIKFSTIKVMGEKGDRRTYYAIKAAPRRIASPVQVNIGNEPSLLFEELNNKLGNSELAVRAWAKTQTTDFKSWFENSTVVDENGEPLVVYPVESTNDVDAEQVMLFSTKKGVNPMYLSAVNPQVDSNGNIVIEDVGQTAKVFNEDPLDLENDEDLYYEMQETDQYYFDAAENIISDFSKLLYFKEDQLSLLKNRLAKVKAARKDAEKLKKSNQSQTILKKLISLETELSKRIGHVTDKGGAGLINEIALLNNGAGANAIQSFAEKDFARLDSIITSSNIHDLKESAQIIEFYEKMYPPSVDKEHPIFSQEEMFFPDGSPRLDEVTWEYYKELATKAATARNILETNQRKSLEAVVNNNQNVKDLNSVPLTYNDLISKNQGLKDLGWFDMFLMDVTMGVASTNGILPQVMYSTLQDSTNRNMAIATALQEELDAMQPAVEAELKKLGHNLSVLGINGISYDMFKQISENGFETGRIVNRYSTKFYDGRRKMNATFRALISQAKSQEDPSVRNQAMTHAFEWRRSWYRENTVQLEIGKIPEIMNNPKFAKFQLQMSSDKAENDRHVAQLKELLGEQGYKQEVAKQVKALERYMNDYDAHADMLSPTQLELFEKENSPFVGNDYFYNAGDIKHFDKVVRPGMKYNISVPRKFKGDVTDKNDATGRYKIEDSSQDLKNYDSKFKEIEKNEVLFNYHNKLTEINKKIREGLPIELQEQLQVNSLPEVEKSMTELLLNAETPLDKFSAVASAFWNRMRHKLTVKIQNHLSYAKRDPLTGKTNYKVNDAFFLENKRKIATMIDIESRRMANALGIETVTDYTQVKVNELTPQAINLLAEYFGVDPTISEIKKKLGSGDTSIHLKGIIKEVVTHQAVQQKSFDLPKVMKMYLDVAAKYKAKNDALPILEIMKKHYETIKSPKVNNVGTSILNMNRGGRTQLDDIRHKAIRQMDDWFNRVVLDNHGITHSGVLKATEDFIGDETKKSKRWMNRILGFTNGEIKNYLNKEELELSSKIDELIAQADDPAEIVELREIKEKLGRSWTMTSMADGILNFIRFKALGFNFSSAVTNLMEGEISNLTLASLGTFFDEDQYWRANAIARKSIVKNITKGLVAHPDAKKLRLLMDKTQILQDSSNELQRSSAKSTYAKVGSLIGPYELNKRTEYLIQTPVVIAMMMNEEVIGIDGEVSNAWDALDVNGKLKSNFRTPENILNWERMSSKKFSKFKKKVEGGITLAHGNYAEMRGMLLKSNIVGKAMIMFKSWLPNAIYSRFATEQDNILTKQKGFKGRYRSFTKAGGSVAGAVAGFSLHGATLGVSGGMLLGAAAASIYGGKTNTDMSYAQDLLFSTKMLALKAMGMPINRIVGRELIKAGDYSDFVNARFSKVDAKNMNANITEMAVLVQKLMLMALVKKLWWDEEDEADDESRKWHNFFMNKFQQILDSAVMYVSPGTLWKTLADAAFIKWVSDVGKTIAAFGDYIVGADTIGSGMTAGESKLFNQASKTFVPGMFKAPFTLGVEPLQQRQFTKSPLDYYFTSDNKLLRKKVTAQRATLRKKLKAEGMHEKRINKVVNAKFPMPRKTKKKKPRE